jgi:PAS domain S-box-containing protein
MELLLRKISSDELNALLELSPQPVVACTINGNIQFLNDRFVQLTGISREVLTGSTLVKSKIAEYDFISAIVEDFKEHRFPESREIHLNSYSGKGSEFLVSAQMVEYEGCQLLITFYGDIPERKALLLKPDNSNRFTDSLNSISAGPRDLCRFELLTWINGELLHSDNPQAVVQNICEKVMEYLMCEIFLITLLMKNVTCSFLMLLLVFQRKMPGKSEMLFRLMTYQEFRQHRKNIFLVNHLNSTGIVAMRY